MARRERSMSGRVGGRDLVPEKPLTRCQLRRRSQAMRLFFMACMVLAVACGNQAPADENRPSDLRHSPGGGAGETSGGDQEPTPERTGELSLGESLYVPVYSHVYYGPRARQFNLACTLSIRNTDIRRQIIVTAVDYYDTAGKLVGHYLEGEEPLAPLATTEYFIEERDVTGGSGANFIVRWRSEDPVNRPLVEAVMIGVNEGQGISLVSRAQEIVD